MSHRPCVIHLSEGETITGRAEPLYDPLTGRRIPINLCGEHRRAIVRMVGGYLALLAEFTPEVDPELICHCGYPARTRQGLSNHETSEHPDPAGQKCPICGEPTTGLKTHMWREHPDGEDAETAAQLAVRTRVLDRCEIGDCTAGPFDGAQAYTSHLAHQHPNEAPRCPVGTRAPKVAHLRDGRRFDCETITLMPDRHIRHRHGIVAFREWVAVGRPGIQRIGRE